MGIVTTFIGLALAGLFIGICSGMLGIGGGTILVPVLRLIFGLNAYAATATSLFTMVFTSVSGAVSHIRQKTCEPKLGIALGLGGCVTSALGVYLGSISPSWAIMLAAAVIIIYSAQNMLRKAIAMPKSGQAKEAKQGAAVAASSEDDFVFTRKTALSGFAIGLLAGLCAGYVGVGGGFIMVPLMTSVLGVPMRKASGTSLVAIIMLSIPGIIGQVSLGHVDFVVGIIIAVGSIPGAALGAMLSKRVPERQLRFIFAGFLAVAGVTLVLNEFGIF